LRARSSRPSPPSAPFALRLALALLVCILGTGSAARADPPPWWPPAAAQRYADAKQLEERGRHAEAADAYRSVADWPDGGPFPQRAESLFLAGVMLEAARSYERAVETYRELARRFPGDDFARKAQELAEGLEQGEPARALAFRRRLDAARDELAAANAVLQREGPGAVQRELAHVAARFEAILHEYEDLPRAKDVALALGDTHMTLRHYREARADYRRAIDLARRAAERPGADPLAVQRDVASAENLLGEATRSIRRRWAVWTAWGLLAATGAGLLLVRPWRAVDRRMLQLAGVLLVGTALLAFGATRVADYLRYQVEDQPPVEQGVPALLVLLPGITGQLVALGFVGGLGASRNAARGWWVVSLAGVLGALAALAVATCIVDAFQLFPFLDSKL